MMTQSLNTLYLILMRIMIWFILLVFTMVKNEKYM